MATFTNTAEGGTTGTTVTTGNSGGASGDAFGIVTIGSGGAITFSSAAAYTGSLGYQLTTTGASINLVRATLANWTQARFRFYVNLGAYPTSTMQWIQGVATGGAAGYLYLTTTGTVQIVNSVGGVIATSTNTLALNTWYRVELILKPGTGTGDGTIRATFATGEGAAIETLQSTISNISTGTLTQLNFGKVNATGTWTSGYKFDAISADDTSSTTFLGPTTVDDNVAGVVATATATAPAGTVTGGGPPISGLVDDFTTQDTAKWTFTAGAPVTGGRVVIAPSTSYDLIISNTAYSLLGSSAFADIPAQVNLNGNANADAWFELQNFSNANAVGWDLSTVGLRPYRVVASTRTYITALTYNSTTHRFTRMRESAGTVYWDTSPDGTTWTNATSWVHANAFDLGNVKLTIGNGYTGTPTPTGTTQIEAVNLITTSATLAGVTATAAAAAPVGTVGVTLAGVLATATATAPAGTVIGGQIVAGVTATATATAPAGVAVVWALPYLPDDALLSQDGVSFAELADALVGEAVLASDGIGSAELAAVGSDASIHTT